MEADSQTDQEMMIQRDELHMVMTAEPTTHFVMVDVVRHFVQKLLNVLLGQIAFWRRASFGYNFHRHGFLSLLPTWLWLEKDTMPFSFRRSSLSFVNIAL